MSPAMGDLVWYIPTALLLVLLCLLVRRGIYRILPCFFAYVAFGVTADAMRFLTRNLSSFYFWTYWSSEGGYDVLGILVMYELILRILGNLARTWWGRLVFPAALLVGVCLSLAHAHSVPPRFSGIRYYIVVGEIAVRCVQALVFTGLVALVLILDLRWRQYPFGIATGFGGYSFVALLMTTRYSDFGTRFVFLYNVSLVVAYSIAVLIWIWFFSAPQQPETPNPNLPGSSPEALKRHQATLEQYLDWLRRMR